MSTLKLLKYIVILYKKVKFEPTNLTFLVSIIYNKSKYILNKLYFRGNQNEWVIKSIRNLCYSIFELTIAIVFLSIIFRQVEFNTLEKVYFVGLVSMAIYFMI